MIIRHTLVLALLCLAAVAPMAQAASPNVVISQVYPGGGGGSGPYRYDYVDLFNTSNAAVPIGGWSLQYGSSTGLFASTTTNLYVFPAGTTIGAGKYLSVRLGTAGTSGVDPVTDLTTGGLSMSATSGKIVLANVGTALGCGSSTALCAANDARIVDLVAYGASTNAEGGVPVNNGAGIASASGAYRKSDGCQDTDNNNSDFQVVSTGLVPRTAATAAHPCGVVTDAAPAITVPANPAATVFVDAAPFSVNLTGNDDGGVYVWSATAGTGVAAVAVTGGQGSANVTYGVTLQAGFTGTATFTASLSDNVNPAATRAVNIQVNPNVVNLAPQIFAPANPIATVAQDAAPFTVNVFGADDNGVFHWSASAGAGVSAVAVSAGQGTSSATFTVTLQPGFSGTATFTASLTDTFNAAVSQAVNVAVTPAPVPPPDHLVISQIYGGGGNSGAALRNDYVELYNPTNSTIDTSGWTIQYGAATNTTWAATPLGGVIQPAEYYLVQLASGGTNGAPLPVEPNVTGDLNLSGTTGKVALVRGGDPLAGCVMSNPLLVDLVGFGTTANCREGSGNAPAPSNSNAIFRKNGGFTDTNVNSADFVTGTPGPRRTAIITEPGPNVLNVDPRNANTTAPRDASLTVTFSESVDVNGAWFNIACASSGLHHDATVAGSGRTRIITPNANFVPGETCTATVFKDFVHDSDLDDSAPNSDTLPANYVWSFSIATGAAPAYTPDVHLTMGNPSDAVADVNAPANYLMEKPELTLSYNRDRGTPNWVSWHLADEWVGSLARVDTFRPDPQVPADWYRVTHIDYSGSGFDRGHMVPNADRDPETSMPINQATFLMSNMLPQSPDNNQGPWASQENYLRTLLPQNELYIIAGGAGTGGTGSNGFANTIANGNVTVPAVTWKVVLVIPKGSDDANRVTAGARTIAVVMPNVQGIRNDDWQNYITTVDAVEALTGYDFFENVADAVENAIEAGTNGVNPPGLENQSFSTNEDDAKSFTFEAANPNNGTLAYTIVTPPSHGTLSGSGATQTYTPAPDFNGSDSFTFRVSNGSLSSNTATMTITVFEKNDAPVATDDALSTNEDAALQFGAGSLTNNDHAGANESQTLTVSSVSATAGTHGTVSLAGGVVTYTPAPNYHGPASFTYSVCDNGVTRGAADSLCATATVHVNVIAVNDAPSVTIAVAASASEGSVVVATAAASDVDGDSLSYAWTVTKNGAPFASTPSFTPDDNGTYVVSVVVSDGSSTATDAKTVTVSNVAPVIAATAGPAASLSLGTAATVSVSFSDAGAADTHSATFTWGDGTTAAVSCSAGVCSATRTYTAAGIYTVGILLADDDGATAASTFQSVIVTDANAGSVTGGGWIDTQAGKGTLVVNAKYQKDGSINGTVKFDVAGSSFTASTYEWLVVSGTTATVKGTGTVDGVAGYAYLVTVNDATPDKFGIRIWNPTTNAVLFDTTTPQPLGGGSITIHAK